jgi:hypothetical protein
MADMLKNEQQSKKPYRKPGLKRVSLKTDEAVLGFCKTADTAGPFQSSCVSPLPCNSQGS